MNQINPVQTHLNRIEQRLSDSPRAKEIAGDPNTQETLAEIQDFIELDQSVLDSDKTVGKIEFHGIDGMVKAQARLGQGYINIISTTEKKTDQVLESIRESSDFGFMDADSFSVSKDTTSKTFRVLEPGPTPTITPTGSESRSEKKEWILTD